MLTILDGWRAYIKLMTGGLNAKEKVQRSKGTLVVDDVGRANVLVRKDNLQTPPWSPIASETLIVTNELAGRLFSASNSMDHTILLTATAPAEVPLGYRTVGVIPFRGLDRLGELLAPYRAGLQTGVLAAPADRWPSAVDALARAGLTQIAAAGSAAARFLGLPHEGEYALRRLIRLVGIDLGAGPLTSPERVPPNVSDVLKYLPPSSAQPTRDIDTWMN